jgi:hypothetical protein
VTAFRVPISRFIPVWEETELAQVCARLPKLPYPIRMWIAGGAVRRSLMLERLTTDIDLFFSSGEAFETFKIMAAEIPGIRITAKRAHVLQFELPLPAADGFKRLYVLQAVCREFYGSTLQLLEDFDFTICQFVLDGSYLVATEQGWEDAKAHILRIANPHTPVSTIRRIIKYHDQGFRIDDDSIKKLLNHVVKYPDSIDRELISSDEIAPEAVELPVDVF